MGSLGSAIPSKRAPPPPPLPPRSSRSFLHRPRSLLARFLLFERVNYLQWICTAAAFFFVVILFESFLPGSVIDEGDGGLLEEVRGLDFWGGIRFHPVRLMERWRRERGEANVTRFGVRRPQIAMVMAGLEADGVQLEMISVAAALKEIGYNIHVYSLKDGPIHAAWKTIGMPINILPLDLRHHTTVD